VLGEAARGDLKAGIELPKDPRSLADLLGVAADLVSWGLRRE
jgi:hypothetical protein